MKIVSSEQLRTFLKRESRTRSSLLPSNPFYPVVVVAAAALFAPAISSPAISLWKRAIRSNRAAANRGRDLLLPRFFSLQRENARRCVRYLLGQKDSSSPVGHPSPSLSLFPSRNLEGFLEKYPSSFCIVSASLPFVEFRKNAMYPPPFRSSFAYLSSPFSPPLLSTVNYVFARSWRRGFKSCKWLHRDAHVHLRRSLPRALNYHQPGMRQPAPSLDQRPLFRLLSFLPATSIRVFAIHLFTTPCFSPLFTEGDDVIG